VPKCLEVSFERYIFENPKMDYCNNVESAAAVPAKIFKKRQRRCPPKSSKSDKKRRRRRYAFPFVAYHVKIAKTIIDNFINFKQFYFNHFIFGRLDIIKSAKNSKEYIQNHYVPLPCIHASIQ
jgi:hypothetical protein